MSCLVLQLIFLISNHTAYFSQLQEEKVKKKNKKTREVKVKYLKVKVGRGWSRVKQKEFRFPWGRKARYYHILMYNTYHSVWLLRAEFFLSFQYFGSQHYSDTLTVVLLIFSFLFLFFWIMFKFISVQKKIGSCNYLEEISLVLCLCNVFSLQLCTKTLSRVTML